MGPQPKGCNTCIITICTYNSDQVEINNIIESNRRDIDEEELGPIRRAQAICKRLRRRDIYAYVDEVTIPPLLVDDDLGMVPKGAAAGPH